MATAPRMTVTMAITIAKTGRSMKKLAMATVRCRRRAGAACRRGGRRQGIGVTLRRARAFCRPSTITVSPAASPCSTTQRSPTRSPVDDRCAPARRSCRPTVSTDCRPCSSWTAFCGTSMAFGRSASAHAHAAELPGQQRLIGVGETHLHFERAGLACRRRSACSRSALVRMHAGRRRAAARSADAAAVEPLEEPGSSSSLTWKRTQIGSSGTMVVSGCGRRCATRDRRPAAGCRRCDRRSARGWSRTRGSAPRCAACARAASSAALRDSTAARPTCERGGGALSRSWRAAASSLTSGSRRSTSCCALTRLASACATSAVGLRQRAAGARRPRPRTGRRSRT